MTFSGCIPKTDIEDIKIYTKLKPNSIAGMKQILQETGYDIVFNGTIFIKHFKPCTHLKVNGRVHKKPNYTAWAISWNSPVDFGVKVAPNTDSNYMQCVKAIVNGKPVDMDYQPDMAYATHRTAIGTKGNSITYYVTRDNIHPEQLRDRLVSLGWDGAIMMDGGGSTAIYTKEGNGFPGDGRLIPFWIIIKLKKKGDDSVEKGMVKAYSLKKDGEKRLSAHFKVREFACKDKSDPIFIAPDLVGLLEKIRAHFNKPIIITSAYRTPGHNAKEGGKPQSQHLYGKAADIRISGVSPNVVANYARSIMPNFGGVGRYSSFTHVDVRDTRSDW